ncbi:Major facilitator super domain-containing protein 6 [Desmophyllum pertusum]|uniref:Major facilitator super domain-containing protein 6 n=1 Tax=Desmophyllum pertusum TaxID=174260 RepID=A0A9W9YDS3_9CNID|nr:Major facilitator super domain-containing protein 6 [Desmophyllum pertusum]
MTHAAVWAACTSYVGRIAPPGYATSAQVAQKCLGPDERMRPNQLDVTTKAKQSPHNSPEVDSPPSVVAPLMPGLFFSPTQRILNSELLVGTSSPEAPQADDSEPYPVQDLCESSGPFF